MSDLISRKALINKFEQWQKNEEWNLLVDVITEIKNMPLATDTNVATKVGTNLAEVGTEAISRQSVIDMLDETKRIARQNIDGAVLMTFERVFDSLVNITNALPTIQPKRGRWIGKYPVTSVCSECGFLIHDSKVKAFAYCPNCGADMRGEQDG